MGQVGIEEEGTHMGGQDMVAVDSVLEDMFDRAAEVAHLVVG